jgi:hypothetical protein
MAIEWQNLRIPRELHGRLAAAAEAALAAHEEGRSALPSEYVERVPLYFVIQQALDEQDAHRERARKQSRAKARPAAAERSSGPAYTPTAASTEAAL